MKRTLALLAAPILLTACVDKNPIEENAAAVYGWYQTHNATLSQGERSFDAAIMKECGDAVIAGKTNDPACEQFSDYFTPKLNASAVLDEAVEAKDWYSKNFWSKWLAGYQERQNWKNEYDKLNKGNPWAK